jgi:imidazolonepropionase-like amidohydrolase
MTMFKPRRIGAPVMVFCCFAFLAGSLLNAGRQSQQIGEATLFEGARLIVGDSSPTIENAALLIERGKILRVGQSGKITTPRGTVRIDVRGKTIMPALINLHGHVGYQKELSYAAENYTRENILDQLNRYAYYGVGAVMSTGTDVGDLPYELRSEPHSGALFRTAGRGFAAPNAGPGAEAMRAAPYGVTSEEGARIAVRELAAKKPDFVKIWVDDRNGTVEKLSPALYRAIITEAHKHNLRVMAHVFYLTDAQDLVRSGVDGFLHLVRDEEMDDRLIALMKERRVFVTPNLSLSERATYAEKPPWLDDPFLAATVSRDVIRRLSDTFVNRQPAALTRARDSYEKQQRSLAKLISAGVTIALGDDSGVQDNFYGYTEHRELELMVNAGMTPAQVIVASTRVPARLLRLDQRGTLEPGKSADLIVLDANPLDDIKNTRKISKVYLRGQEVDRAELTSRWNHGG